MTDDEKKSCPISHVAGTTRFLVWPAFVDPEVTLEINDWNRERGYKRGQHFDYIDQANNASYWDWCYFLVWHNPEDAVEFKLRFM